MKRVGVAVLMVFVLSGCGGLRWAPSEAQKENAWLHERTAEAAAEMACEEGTSAQLRGLTQLGHLQSGAMSAYFGRPEEMPLAETAEEILAEANWELAERARAEGGERPDVFDVADNVLELAIGISALLGGVYGTRAVRFMKEAKEKSKALKEIITGNELFKKEHKEYVPAFKEAQRSQSAATRQIVAQMKT
jgi:hypothetical protein